MAYREDGAGGDDQARSAPGPHPRPDSLSRAEPIVVRADPMTFRPDVAPSPLVDIGLAREGGVPATGQVASVLTTAGIRRKAGPKALVWPLAGATFRKNAAAQGTSYDCGGASGPNRHDSQNEFIEMPDAFKRAIEVPRQAVRSPGYRSGRNAARTSAEKSSGSSQAAK
ncbi:hypothetical protein GCM10028790_24830 [Micromonospora taraxaci]